MKMMARIWKLKSHPWEDPHDRGDSISFVDERRIGSVANPFFIVYAVRYPFYGFG